MVGAFAGEETHCKVATQFVREFLWQKKTGTSVGWHVLSETRVCLKRDPL
jgi:hypothetical protein